MNDMRISVPVPASEARHGRTERKAPVVGLDLLRFCAALAVVGFHLGCVSWIDPRSDAAAWVAGAARYPELLGTTSLGWVGVQMFFVISGFVIAFSAQGAGPRRFLESRFLRLMPGLWICASLTLVLGLGFGSEGATVLTERYLRTLVVWPVPRWIDGVYWTLSIEMAFYALVWALLRLNRFDRLEPVMIGIGLFSAGVWGLAATGWWPGLDVLANKRLAQLLLVTHGCEFALGVLTWRIAAFGVTAPRFVGALGSFAGALLQILASCRAVAVQQGLDQSSVAAAVIFTTFFALVMLALAANAAVLRVLPARVLAGIRLLGLSTYPLYLLHTAVGATSIRAARTLGIPTVPSLLIGVGTAIIVSILVAAFAEPWFRGRLRAATDRLRLLRVPSFPVPQRSNG